MPAKSSLKKGFSLAKPNPDRQALADFRSQIDRIDLALHDLLRERAEIVEDIRKIKGKQVLACRPGREAQIIRTLLARPQGRLPEGLVTRVWREIISASAFHQSPFKVGVYAPEKGGDLWDVARDYFGAFVPLVEMPSAVAAIKALKEEKVSIVLVPPPENDKKDCWWPSFVDEDNKSFTVFAALPFEVLKAGRSNARRALPAGLAIGKLYPELTGADRSMLSLSCVHVPEAEMKRLLSKAGYKVRHMLAQTVGRSGSAPTSFFVETEGYIGRNDTRLARLKAMLGSRLQRMMPLGGYAIPVKGGKS